MRITFLDYCQIVLWHSRFGTILKYLKKAQKQNPKQINVKISDKFSDIVMNTQTLIKINKIINRDQLAVGSDSLKDNVGTIIATII